MEITITDNSIYVTDIEQTSSDYVYVLQRVTLTDTTIVGSGIVNAEKTFNVTTDGYYILNQYELPTTQGAYYYTIDGVIYSPTDEVVTVAQLVSLDPTAARITSDSENIVVTYYLNTKLISYLTDRFSGSICGCGCGCADPQDQQIIDMLTMGLHLIDELVLCGKYYEIERIIEGLSSCVGIDNSTCNCYD